MNTPHKRFTLTTVNSLALAFLFILLGLGNANAQCNLPTNLMATTITSSTATLTWSGSGIFYSIRTRIKTPQGPWIVTSSTPPSKIITGLQANTVYEYQVQTHCSGSPATSGYSPIQEFTTASPCGTPTNLNVYNIKGNTATISWNAPPNAGFYHTRIRIASPQGPWIVATNFDPVKIYINLLPLTTYEFQVATQCSNDPNISTYSSITFTTCAAVIPDFSLTTAGNANSVVGSSCATEFLKDSVGSMYVNDCKNIALIGDTTVGNTLGFTTICSNVSGNIDSTTEPNFRFGQRSYSITPTNNGKAVTVLFFTQGDFNHYNSLVNPLNYHPLPTSGNSSDPNIPNFRIAHVANNQVTMLEPTLQWDNTFNIWYAIIPMDSIKGTYKFGSLGLCTQSVPFNLGITNITGFNATATWTPVPTSTPGWYRFRIREVNSNTWTLLGTSNFNTSSKLIQNLVPQTTYEIQMKKFCTPTLSSPWSASVVFTTPNSCYTPDGINTSDITTTTAKANWNAVPDAIYYTIRYKNTNSSTWIYSTGIPNNKTLLPLLAGNTYEYQVATNCAGSNVPGAFSGSTTFTTNAMRVANEVNSTTLNLPLDQYYVLYPNPTTGILNGLIRSESNNQYQLKIVDLTGRILKNQLLDLVEGVNNFEVDLSELADGIYMSQICFGNNVLHNEKIEKK